MDVLASVPFESFTVRDYAVFLQSQLFTKRGAIYDRGEGDDDDGIDDIDAEESSSDNEDNDKDASAAAAAGGGGGGGGGSHGKFLSAQQQQNEQAAAVPSVSISSTIHATALRRMHEKFKQSRRKRWLEACTVAITTMVCKYI